MAKHLECGNKGEKVALELLEKKGYRILELNWRLIHKEIDIIASNEKELVIVEVKTRTDGFLLNPEEAVDRKKMARLARAADSYVLSNRIDLPVRFDIISVVLSKEGELKDIAHLEDAFYAPLHTYGAGYRR